MKYKVQLCVNTYVSKYVCVIYQNIFIISSFVRNRMEVKDPTVERISCEFRHFSAKLVKRLKLSGNVY